MTLFIRTTIVIGNTPSGGTPDPESGLIGQIGEQEILKQGAEETIVPVSDDGATEDALLMVKATLERQASEVTTRAAEQLVQAADVIERLG